MAEETAAAGDQAKMMMIKIKTIDDKVHEVPIKVAKVSMMVKNMLEACPIDPDDEDAKPIEVQKTDSATLEKILEWCEHHVNDPNVYKEMESEDDDEEYDFDEWDEEWIEKLDEERLFAVILAADFLDIKMLLDLGSKRVANIIKTMTPAEIRKRYNLVNDLTPDEEEKSRKENDLGDNAQDE